MMTYEPLFHYMDEHGLSFYDLERITGLPHGSVYSIKQGKGITLPVINVLMYKLNFHSVDQIVKYYRDGEEAIPIGVDTIDTVDKYFKTQLKKNQNS